MSPRSGLVVELRFEMNGHLVEAFLPPIITSSGTQLPLPPVHWYVQVNQSSAFLGPLYGMYPIGHEAIAEDDLRRFLEQNARLPKAGRTRTAKDVPKA